MSRELDIVVYGATGFVGKLTAEYLAGAAPEGVKIGLGGRSEDKLKRVRDGLGQKAKDWPLVVADSGDPAALKAMAEETRVIATTVGPYRKYGMDLVEACANAGTDYLDLTGEPLFIRDTIDRYHEIAKASGARIAHCCGFDSIPSDLGVLALHLHAQAEDAGDLEDTTYVVRGLKGGASGGTLDSMKVMVDEMKAEPAKRKVAADPYALSPDRAAEPNLGDESDMRFPKYDETLDTWLGPFVMAAINARIVRRSNALQGWAYGKRFRYRETMDMGSGILGQAKAMALTGGLAGLMGGLSFGPTRSVMERFMPAPGEGPSPEARAKGFFKIDIHTRTSSGARFVCRVAAQGDPGYAATAVMLGEGALCAALDRDQLPDAAGVLTPATAFGEPFIERLRTAGHTYDVSAA